MAAPRVLIDIERIRQPNSGLGQVTMHLTNAFLDAPSDDWQPVFLLPKGCEKLIGREIVFETLSWKRKYLPQLAPRYDLWHVLHQDARYVPAAPGRYILTINDLNFLGEKSPKKAAKRLRKVQKLVDRALEITVISKFTEAVVRKNLDLGDTPLQVVHPGLCSTPVDPGVRPDSAPDGEYLFSLGVVRPKKNVHVLIEFLAQLENINLVIAGNTNGGYVDEIKALAVKSNVMDRVIIPGEIDDSQKNWLFNNCKAFVFPSLHEGFGLPVAEAMSFGKPTFAANRTSLPEVGGPDVSFWDDFDPEYMANVYREGMAKFSADPEMADRLKARAAGFSWKRAAEEFSAIYKRHL